MSSISRRVRVSRWRWPGATGAIPGSVTSIASLGERARELRRLERRAPRLELRLERLPRLVRRLADRARARSARARRSRAGSPSARTCGRDSAPAAPRARRRRGGGDRRRRLCAQALDPVDRAHGPATPSSGGADDSRPRTIAAAAATPRLSGPPGRSGIVQRHAQRLEHLGRQAGTLAAEADGRRRG